MKMSDCDNSAIPMSVSVKPEEIKPKIATAFKQLGNKRTIKA